MTDADGAPEQGAARTKEVAIGPPDEGKYQFGRFRVLESFGRAAGQDILDDLRTRVAQVLEDFPELRGETVTIARHQDWDDKLGRADLLNRIVYLPHETRTSYITTYHELGHLAVQVRDERGEDVPTTSEEYCSLLAMTKMPVDRIDENRIPYFGTPGIEKAEWPGVCARALEYREDNRDYIQQAREWLEVDS